MFKVIKDARVKVFYKEMSGDDVRLCVQVENEMPHIFDKNSSENKLLEQMDIKTIEEKFNGGTYIFNHGKMIDYRDGFWNGYVRTQEDMNLLGNIIGSSAMEKEKRGTRGMFDSFRMNSIDKSHFLGGESQDFALEIKELGEGGEFKNRLVYSWSPFDKNLLINLETERLICENGMVGMASFVTKAVPLVNRYQEHLDLINVQLQPQFNSILKNRFKDMSEQRASVHTMLNAHKVLTQRLKENNFSKMGNRSDDVMASYSRLKKISSLLDVRETLGGVYKNAAFNNSEQSRHMEGNLTQFDVFNMLTESSSHTKGSFDNTNKIQKAINVLVFDELNDKKNVKGKVPNIDSNSDHRRAFFGDED